MPILTQDITLKVNPKITVGTKGDKVEILTTYQGFDGIYHCVRSVNKLEKPPFDVADKYLIR